MSMNKLGLALLGVLVGCGGNAPGDGAGDADGAAGESDPTGPGFPCAGGDGTANEALDDAMRCFPSEDDPGGAPVVVIEVAFEVFDGEEAVHVRLTFDPGFVDNQYGDTAISWESSDKGHKFKDLAGSDHADVVLVDTNGDVVFDMSLDYISEDESAPCGWASLGPSGGDGEIRVGDEADVLGWTSSLDLNLNERGYCAFLDDSPATDVACAPSSEAPNWDYRVVYDVWVRRAAFAPDGFGTAHMDEVHASPSKADDNTVTVTPGDCPDDWCEDPDGCDGGDGDVCEDNADCPTGEFCGEGHCVPIVE